MYHGGHRRSQVMQNDTVEYQYWFCGHYHMDARIKAYNLEVLYRNIIKLSKGYPIASRH